MLGNEDGVQLMKVLYITNIPTPYRRYRFNLLEAELNQRGHDLEVFFMAETEPGRHWVAKECMEGFSGTIFRDFNFLNGKPIGHFNPGLIFKMLKSDYDVVVIGGYASFTHLLANLLSNRNKRVLSIESNVSSISHSSLVARTLRKFIFKRQKHFQITGRKVVEYLQHHGIERAPFITLPNVIDESDLSCDKYCAGIPDKSSKVQLELFCVARLSDVKGLEPFLTSIDDSLVDSLSITVAGDGPLRQNLLSIASKKRIPLRLLGHVDAKTISSYMKGCDFFLLPSKQDPSPLSVIEALYFGKPLLLSDRVGNLPESLEESNNGFSFDISSPNSINCALAAALQVKAQNRLTDFGACSAKLYERRFQPEKVINSYVNQLEAIVNGKDS